MANIHLPDLAVCQSLSVTDAPQARANPLAAGAGELYWSTRGAAREGGDAVGL